MDGHAYSSSSEIKPAENNSSDTYVLPDRNPFRYDDECKGIEFPVRNFWKLAKIQNDIESLTEGHCNGFYYRLLLHPRGTAGTDSESNHLSVFLEAVVQDWYPDYWVFPNVRFELAVVNFKDPKLSVTSWAHWSFSSDATSRGWQKMISHSKLTKAAGFMDDEGTILVRGKAEPPYPRLWSHVFPYRPTRLWSSLRSASNYDMSDGSNSCELSEISESTDMNYSMCVNPYHQHERFSTVMDRLLAMSDSLVPSIQPTLDSDVLSLFVCILYNIKEFRKMILSFPSNEFSSASNTNYSLISALQETFAYMYMYPIAAITKAKIGPRPLGLSVEDFYQNEITSDRDQLFPKSFLSFPIYFEPILHVNCSAVDCIHCNYKNSLYSRSGERVSPTVPNVKKLLLTLHMNDLQYLEVSDPIIKIHTSIFTMLLRDLALAKKATKQVNNKPLSTKATQLSSELESACTRLFSPSPYSDGLFRSTADDSIGDLSSVYIKCKHIYSLQKSLESSGRVFARYPDVLFFYLQPNKNTKKGELFDVPLRLDATCLVPHYSDIPNMNNTTPRADTNPDSHDNTSDRPDFNDSQNCSIDSEYRKPNQGGFKASGDKWYSLYAVIIREGDASVPHTFSLLLRPDEDGLWYRVSDGRIERLETKMEFTEWKCHREFFCASAVYIAEDYIDTVQARDVDLSGDLKAWNRDLYFRTLDKLGISELDILFEKYHYNDHLDYYHPRCNNVLIRRYNIGITSLETCLLHGFNEVNFTKYFYQTMKKSCIYLDSFQAVSIRLKRLALLQPLMSMIIAQLNNPSSSLSSSGNFDQNLLSKCLELEFITSFGEIFFSERISQLLYDGSETPPAENQLHLTPQGRLFGFHVTMLLIQPLRNLFSTVLDFIKYITSGISVDALFSALENFCAKIIEIYAECDSLLSLSGSRIRNIHYVIIDELRGTVKNAGSDFINHNLGLSCDFLNPKYDLPIPKTNELMVQLNAQYGLPNLFDMLCFLRQHGVYLHGLIRPHEIARMYIQVRYWNSNDSSMPFNMSFNSMNNSPNQTMISQPTNNSVSPVLGRTINPLKSPIASSIVWNEELFVGASWNEKNYIERTAAEKSIQNVILKVLIHSISHSSQLVDQEHMDLITELDLLGLAHIANPTPEDADKTTCKCPPAPPVITTPLRAPSKNQYKQIQSLYAVIDVDQKIAHEVDPLIFPAPSKPGLPSSKGSSASKELTSGKNSLDSESLQKTSLVPSNNKSSGSKGSVSSGSISPKSINSASLSADDNMHYPNHSKSQSLAKSLSDTLDPEFRRLLGERLFNSPLFNDLFSIPDVQCGDLFSHVVSDVCTIQVGLIFSNDLFGLEGFCIEDKIFPFRRLTVNIELSINNNKDISQRGYGLLARAEHLYWGLHKLFNRILPEEVGFLGYIPSAAKKNKSKSGDTSLSCCENECLSTSDECISIKKWKATSSRDGFFLYALRSDIDASRRVKKRFIYMHPDVELASYIDPRKTKKMPGLVVLVAFAPPSLIQTPTLFPLPDDSGYPLLIFKWMCTEKVDLLTVGAIVCDSKCHLQYYITENVLPFVDELGYMLNSKEDDFSKFIVFEECGIRALQNVRRCSCAIRKINKRTGDVIILQLKRQADSPASLKYKDTAALISCIKELEEMDSSESLPPPAISDPSNFEGSFLTLGSIPPSSIDPPPEIQDENSHIHTTTSDANITADGNSVFAEDEQTPDDDKRLSVATKKKTKAKRKVVIPCNKKSTFNKQVALDESIGITILSSSTDTCPNSDLDVCINEFEQSMNNMYNEFDISKCMDIGKNVTLMINMLDTNQKEEFIKFIGNFFNLHLEDAHIIAPVFACIQQKDFTTFPKNTLFVKFLLVALGYLSDLEGSNIEESSRAIFRHLLSLNIDFSEIRKEVLEGENSDIPSLLQKTTQLALSGVLMKNDLKTFANKLGLSIFQVNPELLLECSDDFIVVLEKQKFVWSLDYPHVYCLPSVVVLATVPVQVNIDGGCCNIETLQKRVSVMLPKELSEESLEYSVVGVTPMQYNVGEHEIVPLEIDNWDGNHLQTKRMRKLRVLQANLLRNLASLLALLQRRIQPQPSTIKWPKLIFGQSGELISISLPNGALAGSSDECSIKRPLIDTNLSISHGQKNWKFLILLACNTFKKHFAASILRNDEGMTVWISSKFVENIIIPDEFVYDMKNLFEQTKGLLEQIQKNVNLTSNLLRNIPNAPINPTHVLQKSATLLLTRINTDVKPCRKMFLPLEAPEEMIPTIVSRIEIEL